MTEAKKVEVNKDELPEGWAASTLGDIASYIQRGKSPKYTEFSALPVVNQKCIRWHGIDREHVKYIHPDQFEKWEEKRFLQNGDLLWNSTGTGTIGRAAIVHLKDGEKLVADSHVTIVRSGEGVEPKYVHYWVMSPAVQNSIEAMQSGSTNQVELSKGAVESTPIPVAPPEQQKRIVAKIEELFSHIDAGISALKKAKQLLKQYRQSVLKAAVTGELTKEWREANKDKLEPASQLLERILKERRQKWEEQQLEQFKAKGKMPKDEKWKEKYRELETVSDEDLETLPETPDEWVYTRLGNVIDAPKYGTSKKCTYDPNGIGVLRIPNLANGIIDAEDLKYASFETEEIESYKLIEGDILTIRSNGSLNLVGKCALIDERDTKYLYAGYLIRLRPFQAAISAEYLLTALNSKYLRSQIEKKAKSTSGVNNINSGELQSLIIPVGGIEEQNEVVRSVVTKIESIDRLDGEIDIQLVKAGKNKQSLLSAAFSGELVERKADDGDVRSLLESISTRAAATDVSNSAQSPRKKMITEPKTGADKVNLVNLIHRKFGNDTFAIGELLAETGGDDFGDLKSDLFELLKNQVEGQYRLNMLFDEATEQYLFSLELRSHD